MEIIVAQPHHAREVASIVSACVVDMVSRGIDQWNSLYPNLEVVQRDVDRGALYVALEDDRCIGAVSLDGDQDPAYAPLPWMGDEPALVVHRLCVSPADQGRGVASRLMDFAEASGAAQGYASVRLDAYTGNPGAIGLYTRRGYTAVGEVRFPRRAHPFLCMEKALR